MAGGSPKPTLHGGGALPDVLAPKAAGYLYKQPPALQPAPSAAPAWGQGVAPPPALSQGDGAAPAAAAAPAALSEGDGAVPAAAGGSPASADGLSAKSPVGLVAKSPAASPAHGPLGGPSPSAWPPRVSPPSSPDMALIQTALQETALSQDLAPGEQAQLSVSKCEAALRAQLLLLGNEVARRNGGSPSRALTDGCKSGAPCGMRL